jgi:4-diphosphocytidyl-2-C-methyl-D-erythritol kinase
VSGLTIETAAKINLCLRVLGRRADGYHEVETVLHTVGVWDRVAIRDPESSEVSLSITGSQAPEGEANLCWRAASLLAERTGVKRGAAIALHKGIPLRSGLGGGSSDAAATLVGLSRLWGLDLPADELDAIAAEVGADVPFFLRGGCWLARGMGEKLTPCPELTAWLVIVAPERGVSTGQAYAALRRGATLGRRRAPSRPIKRLMDALKSGDSASVAVSLHNDFEAAKIAGVDDALSAKTELLASGCLGAVMSGSGSAVFGIARDQGQAEQVASSSRRNWPWVAVAPTVGAGSHMRITGNEGGS